MKNYDESDEINHSPDWPYIPTILKEYSPLVL